MNTDSKTIVALVATLGLIYWCLPGVRAETPNQRIVDSANAFLLTLDQSQRQRVLYSFDDTAQRARWSNFPTGFVPRGGLSLKEMTAQQQAAVMTLLGTVLSPEGLEKVQQIREADDDFKTNGSKRGPRGGPPVGGSGGPPRGPGGPPLSGPGAPPPQFGQRGPGGPSAGFGSDLYYISFLGMPSATSPWMLQFGGHHLALNITIAVSKGVL